MFRTSHGRVRSILAVCAVLVTVAALGGCSARASSEAYSAEAYSADAASAVAGDRLPDLIALPPEAFHWGYQDGHRGLRFTSLIQNIGDGPIDVTGERPDTSHDMKVTQNIFQSSGGQRHVLTDAVMQYSVKDGHNHFHLLDLALYRIRPVDSATWQEAHKEGFCLVDDADLQGRTPFQYPDDCGADEPDALEVREGLSVGWVDDYNWTLWGQFFDVTGLSLPGDFCVDVTVDPLHLFSEKTTSNNSASSLIHLTPETVTVVRQGC